MDVAMAEHPRTLDEIFDDCSKRREGLMRAITKESDKLYNACDPEKENLCLYGHPDGSWEVGLPAEEVPLELPKPVLGINFARDGMHRKDWLALVAVHSDCWLLSVAFFYGAKMDRQGREKLFRMLNQYPTLYETVTGHVPNKSGTGKKRKQTNATAGAPEPPPAQAADTPLASGRLLRVSDITPQLVGRQAELYWPDDNLWYLVEIARLDVKERNATIQYTSGEIEDLDLMEIIDNGHMSLLNQ